MRAVLAITMAYNGLQCAYDGDSEWRVSKGDFEWGIQSAKLQAPNSKHPNLRIQSRETISKDFNAVLSVAISNGTASNGTASHCEMHWKIAKHNAPKRTTAILMRERSFYDLGRSQKVFKWKHSVRMLYSCGRLRTHRHIDSIVAFLLQTSYYTLPTTPSLLWPLYYRPSTTDPLLQTLYYRLCKCTAVVLAKTAVPTMYSPNRTHRHGATDMELQSIRCSSRKHRDLCNCSNSRMSLCERKSLGAPGDYRPGVDSTMKNVHGRIHCRWWRECENECVLLL